LLFVIGPAFWPTVFLLDDLVDSGSGWELGAENRDWFFNVADVIFPNLCFGCGVQSDENRLLSLFHFFWSCVSF